MLGVVSVLYFTLVKCRILDFRSRRYYCKYVISSIYNSLKHQLNTSSIIRELGNPNPNFHVIYNVLTLSSCPSAAC